MKYKQHHKEVTVDLHKIINRLMYIYIYFVDFFYRTTTNVPRRNNQNDEGANGDADAGGAGTEQAGTTNKVRTIRIILMLTIMMHAHLKIKVDLLLNVGKRCKCSSRKCSKH